MRIEHVNGTFWNQENNCWTVAEQAASEYRDVWDVPFVIEDLGFDYGFEAYYFDGDVESV